MITYIFSDYCFTKELTTNLRLRVLFKSSLNQRRHDTRSILLSCDFFGSFIDAAYGMQHTRAVQMRSRVPTWSRIKNTFGIFHKTHSCHH